MTRKMATLTMIIIAIFALSIPAFMAGCGGGGGGGAAAPAVTTGTITATSNKATTVTIDGTDRVIGTDGATITLTEQSASSHTFVCKPLVGYTVSANNASATLAAGATLAFSCQYTAIIACSSDNDCDDSNALTIDACANPGLISSVCAHRAIACNVDLDCQDHNSNTVDTCANGGTTTAACSNTVSRPIEVQITAVNPTSGNVLVNGANVVIVNPSGATVFSGLSDVAGKVTLANQPAGNFSVTVTQAAGSVPHFVAPAVQTLTVAATGAATATFNVTPAYAVQVDAVNVNLTTEFFTGADIHMICSSGVFDQVAATGSTTFVDVPYATGCALSVTNPSATVPAMVTDLPATGSVDVTDDTSVTISAAKPTCVDDAQCALFMPGGMTVAQCYNGPGTTTSACRYAP